MCLFIEEALKPQLIGKNPMQVEPLWDLMYSATFLYGRKGFALHAISADVIQPDATKSGGIWVCRKIFALAEAWNVGVATHSYFFGPGIAATIHLALSHTRIEYVEMHALPLEASFIQPPLRPEKGYITVPAKAGLGIDIDEDVVRRYPYTGMSSSLSLTWAKP